MQLIRAEKVSKHYGALLALDNINLSIKKGEVLGLLGPNGAGKSTLIKILTGYHFPDEGGVEIAGYSMISQPTKGLRHIGYLPEQLNFYQEFLVNEYLDFIAGAYFSSKKEREQAKQHVIKLFKLEAYKYAPIHTLSKGFKQRLGLAQALIHDPEIIILDEPTNGLDPQQVVEFRQFIQKLSEKKTILLSSHVMSEVEALCQSVAVINKGRLVAHGETDQIRQKFIDGKEFYLTLAENVDKSVIEKQFPFKSFHQEKEGAHTQLVIHTKNDVQGYQVVEWAYQKGFKINSLKLSKQSLEDIFVQLTKERA